MAKAQIAEMTPELNAKLYQWTQLDKQLTELKAQEMALRVELVVALTNPSKLEGTQTLAIGNGWKLKASKVQRYTLTNKSGQTVELLQALTAANRADVATALVKWEPEMSISAYKDILIPLVPSIQGLDRLLAAALTIKPGAPTLDLIPPEEKK